MTHRNRMTGSTPGVLLAGCLCAALLVLGLAGSHGTAEARGGAGAPRPAQPRPPTRPTPPRRMTPNQVLGASLFDQCIRWVARGQSGITRTTDFHINVIAELDLDTARHRGPMRLWWKAPNKFRQELTTNNRTTAKLLNGDFMWIVHPTGKVQRMHGTSEGANAIAQLKEDRERMADLAQFITLRSLKGPGVTFDFVGEKSGRGSYAGQWLKITRRAPGTAVMHFWLAYDKDKQGRYSAKWPGVVRIDGDKAKRIPTEDFILGSWADSPATRRPVFRYPRVIEAFSRSGTQPPVRFLKATVQDIQINTGMADGRFRPPLPKKR